MGTARQNVDASQRMSDALTGRIAALCLYAIATNAVLIQTIVDDSASSLKTVIRVAVLAIAGLTLLLRRAHVPTWVVLTVLTSAALMVLGHNPDQLSYIFVLTLVPLLTQVDPRRMDKYFVIAGFLSLVLVFLFLWSGLTINEVRDFRNRATFGVASVPFFMNVVYGAGAMLILYCRKYRPRWGAHASVAYLGLATYFFSQTDGRGGYFALVLFVVLIFVIPRLASVAPFRLAVALLPAGFVGFAFLIANRAGDSALNRFLSNRPYNYRQFIDRLSASDFLTSASVKQFDVLTTRQGLYGEVTRGTFVDNSYLHLLVGGGVILMTVVLVAYASAVFELFRRKMYPEIALMTASAFYFNTESILVRIENVFVIYVWYLIVRYAVHPAKVSPSEPNKAWRDRRRAVLGGRRELMVRDKYLSGSSRLRV